MSREVEIGVGIVIIVLAIAGLVLGVGGSTSDETGSMEETSQPSTGESDTDGNSQGKTGPRSGTITITSDGFSPSTLQLSSGEITLTVRNQDQVTHSIRIDGLGIDQLIRPEESETFSVTASPGEYTYEDFRSDSSGTLTIS